MIFESCITVVMNRLMLHFTRYYNNTSKDRWSGSSVAILLHISSGTCYMMLAKIIFSVTCQNYVLF